MSMYQRSICYVTMMITLGCVSSAGYAKNTQDTFRQKTGTTRLAGSVISSPCTIVMKDRYQAVNITPLTLSLLSESVNRDKYRQPFEIELQGCSSRFSSVDSKTWIIRFDGIRAENTDSFELQGPSRGLGVSLHDNAMKLLTPGTNYPLHNNMLLTDKSGNSLFLRYFLKPELTGLPIQAGSYQGLIRFSIDYK